MQEQWDQGGQILQGGIERGLASGSPEDFEDATNLALAMAEIHVLRRNWPQAVDSASQVVPSDTDSTAGLAACQDNEEPGIFKLAAAAAVAQVCVRPHLGAVCSADHHVNTPCASTNRAGQQACMFCCVQSIRVAKKLM